MNDLTVTVTGWVATEPKLHVGAQKTSLVSFRLASTSRYFDRTQQEWVDNPTEWFTVKAFRNPAVTIKRSVIKGQPVIVHGRLKTSEWEGEDGKRTDLIIDAISVGHDLTKGVAAFTRATGDATLDGELEVPAPAAADTGHDADAQEADAGETEDSADAEAVVDEAEREVALSAS